MSPDVTDQYLKLAQSAAHGAGLLLRDSFSEDAGIADDSGKDIKTEADNAAETLILDAISSTGLPVLTEESGAHNLDSLNGPCWIIDPLDGTFNFTRGFPMCCVSIALWENGQPHIGVVFDFGTGCLFSGVVGQGAMLNGKPVTVAGTSDIGKAVLATGFPSARDYGDEALAASIRKIQQFKKIRMIGSAATSLAQVAAGRFDAYFEEDIWLWDVAAGLALVKAAGGDYTMSAIKPTWQVNVLASNGKLPLVDFI